MATVHQVLASMQAQVSAVTVGRSFVGTPLTVQAGILWPPLETLRKTVKMAPPTALVSVYDRKSGHDSTRWLPTLVAQTSTATAIQSAPSEQVVLPGASAQITVSGMSVPGDAISLVASTPHQFSTFLPSGDFTPAAVVLSPLPSSLPQDIAAGLVAVANADPKMGVWLACTSSGPVLTLTNTLGVALTVSSFTGNGGTQTQEIGRVLRQLQLTVWAAAWQIRDIVSDPIDQMISLMEVFLGSYPSGLVMADGSFGYVKRVNDFLVDEGVKADLFRHDFIVSVDYPVTVLDQLYSVLAPVSSYNVAYAGGS